MRFLLAAALRRSKHGLARLAPSRSSLSFHHHYHKQHLPPERPSFGIAFDIDGVLLCGHTPIGGATRALRRLYGSDGDLKFPFIFLTNGGGVPESKRALELSRQLGIQVLPRQVVQGHSPFKNLVNRFENELVVAVGKGEPAAVMSEYGFKKVISIDDYSSYFEGIDPLAPFKRWEVKQVSDKQVNLENLPRGHDAMMDPVQGVFIVSDPVDWGRDIQVLCDILRTGGRPGNEIRHQPPLYFANDDLEYQSTFPSERLGMGAFRIVFESVFNRIHNNALEYTSFGKPHPSVFNNAKLLLEEINLNVIYGGQSPKGGKQLLQEECQFRTLYMIGDNPSVDVQGARKAGHPWFSILTRTGVFKGKNNDSQFPADLPNGNLTFVYILMQPTVCFMVVDTVEDAVEFILDRQKS